ncbi:hypothetical protein [Ideonella paludis]|uniref:hypothetical protein n=1 Tax=Ideonella paludis TaxID=1233411 RepID=UPI0036315275
MSAAHELASRCAVLLIEDQALVRDLAAQTLRMRLGCTVEAAGTLAEARKLIDARGADAPFLWRWPTCICPTPTRARFSPP